MKQHHAAFSAMRAYMQSVTDENALRVTDGFILHAGEALAETRTVSAMMEKAAQLKHIVSESDAKVLTLDFKLIPQFTDSQKSFFGNVDA